MPHAVVAIGSNLGDTRETFASAIKTLDTTPDVSVLRVSVPVTTTPVDCPPGSPDFLNAAVLVETRRPPHDLLDVLLDIERVYGRTREVRNGPRTLDLDLLCYEDVTLDTPRLTLPHPRLHERRFALAPLAAVWPNWRHPTLGRSAEHLLQDL